MRSYLVTLAPLGKFFFGGDMTFLVGTDEKSEHNAGYASYIIESNKFPQQTSLLGMMRYLLLSADEKAFDKVRKKIVDRDAARALIGPGSFAVQPGHGENDFGKIAGIGPCFLLRKDAGGETALWTAPKDSGLYIKARKVAKAPTAGGTAPKGPGLPLQAGGEVSCSYNAQPVDMPLIEGYDPKAWRPAEYVGEGVRLKEDDVFKPDTRIGIEKDYKGQSLQNAFYKQIAYRLAGRLSFAFYAGVADDIDLAAYNGTMVSLGADGSRFAFHAEEKPEGAYPRQPGPDASIAYAHGAAAVLEDYDKVVLLSDACLTIGEARLADFGVTGTVPFRFLQTTVDTGNYHMLGGKVFRTPEKYYLYERGSVFYFKKREPQKEDSPEAGRAKAAFLAALGAKKEFYQIGYNHYTEIVKKD